jgi:hypothetical protein
VNATTSEIDRQIENVRVWLATHTPKDSWTAGQRQAYDDRLLDLAHWLAASQRS